MGHVIELYADFTRSGANYTPYPDARSHRIRLPRILDTLEAVGRAQQTDSGWRG